MRGALAKLILLDNRSALLCTVSAVLGFVLLAGLGRFIATTNYIDTQRFHRFHLFINPQTLYYPTASQVVSLAKAEVRRDQVAVILGGSSVIWGAGQSDEELWSRHLQTELGDHYKVVNLAMPSGSPQEFGGVATEALLKDGYQVISVPDLGSTFGPPDGLFYPYVYWDAFYKGYLFDNPAGRRYIERVSPARTLGGPLEELKLQGALGGWFYFTDLWNAFGYKVLFTAWNYLVYPPAGEFYSPRGTLQDPQAHYPEQSSHSSPALETALNIIRDVAATACPTQPSGPRGADGAALYWTTFHTEADAAFPPPVRPHMLVVRVYQSRFYRDALTAHENDCYSESMTHASIELRQLGYGATEVGQDWTIDDYIDISHPSPEGGILMAQQLATEVEHIASQLGYLSD